MSNRYEGMDRDALIQTIGRMDRELRTVWRWYGRLEEWVSVTVPCGYCGAGDGESCRTARGRHIGTPAQFLHADRWQQVREIRGGWDE